MKIRGVGEAGQAALEYSLISALIAVAVVGILLMVDSDVQTPYQIVVDSLANVAHIAPAGDKSGGGSSGGGGPSGGTGGGASHANCPTPSLGIVCTGH